MLNKKNLNVDKYIKSSCKLESINWWHLPDLIKLKLSNHPTEIKRLGDFTTIKRLKLCQDKN